MPQLQEVAQILGGGTPSRTEPRYFGGGIAWATPTDVTALENLYIERTRETLTDEGLSNCSAKLLPAGSVLLTSRATIGFTAINKVPICTNQGFVNFICGPNLEAEYLAYWLRAKKPLLERLANGVTFKEISRGTVRKLDIELPDRSEQRRIVDLLTRAESIVRMRREADAKTKEIIPALFLDMFGDPARNERHWEIATLKSLSVRGPEYGANAKSAGEHLDGPRYVRITDIDDDGELRPGDKVGIVEGDWSEYELADGDIVIARSGNTVGKSLLYRAAYGPCVFAGYLIRFRPDRERVQPEYLGVALRTEYFKAWVASHRRAAGQPNINGKEYADLVLPVPPQDLQTEFARQVQNVRAMSGSQRGASTIALRAFESLLAGVFGQ